MLNPDYLSPVKNNVNFLNTFNHLENLEFLNNYNNNYNFSRNNNFDYLDDINNLNFCVGNTNNIGLSSQFEFFGNGIDDNKNLDFDIGNFHNHNKVSLHILLVKIRTFLICN